MAGYIEVQELRKRFQRQTVLDSISFDVDKGESVAIIGQSGTGKSVLLKHLIRLIRPDSGRVLFEGKDIATFAREELHRYRRRYGMLFQSAALFDSMSVGENIGLALRETERCKAEEVQERVSEMLDIVGLGDTAKKYPSEISGGMRKRVGLARAIATRPEILLYDEPTSGLDPVTSELINDLIVHVNTRLKVTSITVTHDMKSAFKIAGRIILLYEGHIEFDGTPDEVRGSDNAVLQQFVHGRSEGPIQVG